MRLLLLIALVGCQRDEPAPRTVDPAGNCPPVSWGHTPVTRAAAWPGCPIDPPHTQLAARCKEGRGCMRPCEVTQRPPMTNNADGSFNVESHTSHPQYDADGHVTFYEQGTCTYEGGHPKSCTSFAKATDSYTFEHEQLVRVVSTNAANEVNTETFSYDPNGRLVRSSLHHATRGGDDLVTDYRYDAVGRLSRIERSGDLPIELGYDTHGRLVRVTGRLGEQYHYDASGRIDWQQVGNPTRLAVSYDAAGRLIGIGQPSDGRWSLSYSYDCK